MSSVDVEGVEKAFEGQRVLQQVDLAIADGTTLALLGPSGSGKSTLLRTIAGLVAPDAGVVRLDGVDVTGTPAHRRGVGVVFQQQALFPHLDVSGNVGFGLRMAGVAGGERRRRVGEALDLVGLEGQGGRDPATLSGGEAQRVALARALAPRPGVLLLDEPFAALDQVLREHLLIELRTLFDDLDVTVVAVTHDPTEAGALGDRIAVLLDGRITQVDAAAQVLSRPASARVAGLVGQRNVAEGVLDHGVVRCAWGPLPVHAGGTARVTRSGAAVDVLIPPSAVRVLGPPGPLGEGPVGEGPVLDGLVVGQIFRGGTAFAVVRGVGPEPAWPALDVWAPPGLAVGDVVRLAIDTASVHLMPRDGTAQSEPAAAG